MLFVMAAVAALVALPEDGFAATLVAGLDAGFAAVFEEALVAGLEAVLAGLDVPIAARAFAILSAMAFPSFVRLSTVPD